MTIFFRISKKYFTSILLIICVFDNAFAQKIDADSSKLKSLEELLNTPIISATKTEIPLSSSPSTMYVINAQQIKARGYIHLGDVLADIPEIEVNVNVHEEEKDAYTVRGIYGNNKIVVLLNGIRYSPESGDSYIIGSNFSLEIADRVEILIGAASALYGADSYSGVVNIISKKGSDLNGASVSISAGQFNTSNNSFVMGSTISNNFSFVSSGHYSRTNEADYTKLYQKEYAWYNDFYKNDGKMRSFTDTLTLPNSPRKFTMENESYSFNLQFNIEKLELGYARNSEQHSSSLGIKPEYSLYSNDAIWKTNSELLYANHHFTFTNNKFSLQSTLKSNLVSLDPKSKYVNIFNSYMGGYKYKHERVNKFEEQLNYTPNKNTNLSVGFAYTNFNTFAKTADLPTAYNPKFSSDQQNLYYLGTNIVDSAGKDLTVYHNFHEISYSNFGGFLQIQSKIGNLFDLTFGTRYDYNTRYGQSINPRVALVFNKWSKGIIKFSYGRAFRSPSPTISYGHYGSFQPNTDSSGNIIGLKSSFWHLTNPYLKPEILDCFEVMFRYNLFPNLILSANGYYNGISQIINETFQTYSDSTFKGYPVDVIEIATNIGNSTTWGGTFRIESKYTKKSFYIKPTISYSYSDGRINDVLNNERLIASAKHTLKMGVESSFKQFSAYFNAFYRSQSFNPNGNSSDPYFLLNGYASYSLKLKKNKIVPSLFVKVTNILNTRYYNTKVETQDQAFEKVPQAPFWLNVGFNIQFK